MDEGILSMAYAHDASRVAVLLGDRSIEIWDATNGKCLSKLDYPEDMRPYPSYISQIKFSIDSKTLAVAHSKVSIWDVESGIYLRTLEAHNDKTTTICFSYDSHWLASVSRDDTIKIWDAHNGNLSKSLVQTDSLQAVFFFRDNIRLASASEFQIVIWNWYSGEVLQVLQTGASVITASLDSEKFASCGESPDTQIWDANSYTPTHTLEGHNDRVNSLSFSHDAQLLASASGDGSVKIWDSSGHGNVQRAERQSLRLVHDVTLSFDSMQVATTGGDSSIQVWDVESGKCTWVLESQTAFVRSIVFSRDNPRQLASLSEDNIKLWNTNTGNCLTTLVPQESKIASISFFDGSRKLLSLSENGVLQIWDTAIGRCVQRHNFRKTDTGRHYIMTLSDDSRFLAIAVDNFIIEIWDLRISTCIQTVSYEGFVTAMSFSNGSTYLAAAVHYGHGLVWNMRSGDRLHKFYCESGVDRLFFDATGSFLRTNHGEIDIAASTRESGGQKKKMPRYRGLALERDLSWITYNSEPLLFIPSEYRVTEDRFDVLGNVIVIVDGSNRLWMYTFDLEKLELEIS
jgi:WD40 repeat protein